ncbi:Poly(A)-specific ribonuclease [Lachnellula subtilissima]|uniref:Poly(A)-specific ribonuclease n=1 Tax=Lachnellula subtilissima TaxID=602034 RepID=A0A8H8UF97_9HELO|nr:Poly(A)-specific ribonuclease [Lachnellula subtilissima]
MDVKQQDFRLQLLPILKNIANAKFVTFDLEMSGITTRPRYGPGDRSQDIGKPSLQQQYEEMRSAAELYQIVQLGITCVEENTEKGFYLARPYNFYLSPLSADGVDLRLERNFTFSTSACDFLTKNHFDFGRMFREGIPYLSQREQRDVEEEYDQRENRAANIPDITIPPSDTANLKFVRQARQDITAWSTNPKPENDYVNVRNPGHNATESPLNAFQRRLIYQLVRKEFPNLRTFARNHQTFMRVESLDVKKEEEYQKRKSAQFNYQVSKQVGLRWIFEALSGGDLSGLDPRLCVEHSEDTDYLKTATIELKTIIEVLRIKKQVLVGHNLFTDLGFLYSAFVDKLPHDVHHFQAEIHERFPLVLDTKFLATEGLESNTRYGLRDLLEPFKQIDMPLILLHDKHASYNGACGMDHEAGFDSWMTAELFVKLTAKLYSERKHQTPFSDDSSDNSEQISLDDDSGGANLNGSSSSSSEHSILDNLPSEWHAKQLNNRFAALAAAVSISSVASGSDVEAEGGLEQWIPKISHSFWDVYANKLRVNASEGGVCDLEDGYES